MRRKCGPTRRTGPAWISSAMKGVKGARRLVRAPRRCINRRLGRSSSRSHRAVEPGLDELDVVVGELVPGEGPDSPWKASSKANLSITRRPRHRQVELEEEPSVDLGLGLRRRTFWHGGQRTGTCSIASGGICRRRRRPSTNIAASGASAYGRPLLGGRRQRRTSPPPPRGAKVQRLGHLVAILSQDHPR